MSCNCENFESQERFMFDPLMKPAWGSNTRGSRRISNSNYCE